MKEKIKLKILGFSLIRNSIKNWQKDGEIHIIMNIPWIIIIIQYGVKWDESGVSLVFLKFLTSILFHDKIEIRINI